ncbi:MAG: dienelactone hydrolase family protein [Hyphomicrobiaceae bacterium]|nr:dienelactone hydrolase family protein [Hyphomicrobiaceae bacterium]
MPNIELTSGHGPLPCYLAKPEGNGPWPGVVILHDAMGMTKDLRNQADWLASEGFLALAPDLYSWGGKMRCMISLIRSVMRRAGRAFDEVEAARSWLEQNAEGNGKVGVIGFCMGGGFAVLLSPRMRGFSAASINYGNLPDDAETLLADACPIVASYGAKDKSLKGAAEKLDGLLASLGVPHDVKEYPEAGHSFLNDHDPSEVPMIMRFAGAMIGGTDYNAAAAADARVRIARFYREHLA